MITRWGSFPSWEVWERIRNTEVGNRERHEKRLVRRRRRETNEWSWEKRTSEIEKEWKTRGAIQPPLDKKVDVFVSSPWKACHLLFSRKKKDKQGEHTKKKGERDEKSDLRQMVKSTLQIYLWKGRDVSKNENRELSQRGISQRERESENVTYKRWCLLSLFCSKTGKDGQ